MAAFISGKYSKKVCEVFNLDPKKVRTIKMDLSPKNVCTMNVEFLFDEDDLKKVFSDEVVTTDEEESEERHETYEESVRRASEWLAEKNERKRKEKELFDNMFFVLEKYGLIVGDKEEYKLKDLMTIVGTQLKTGGL